MQEPETYELISSDKVEGTNVYGPDGTKIGVIESVMLGKRSGKVSYAVLSFGGFLGLGDEHYPLPWSALDYDTELGGYRTTLTREQLDGAPKYANERDWDWSDPERQKYINQHYGMGWV